MRNREGVASREEPIVKLDCRASLLSRVVFRRVVAVCTNCSRFSCERNNTSITALSDVMSPPESPGTIPRSRQKPSVEPSSQPESQQLMNAIREQLTLFGSADLYSAGESNKACQVTLPHSCHLYTADLRFTSAFHNAHTIAIDHQTLVDKRTLNFNDNYGLRPHNPGPYRPQICHWF